MTTPLERLRAVAKSMPVTDQAAAQRAADAQKALALGAVGAAAAKGGLTGAAVQGAAGQVAQAQAQPGLAAAAQSQDAVAKIGQAAVQTQAAETQATQQARALTQGAQQANLARDQAAQLANADRAQKLNFTQAELDQQAQIQTQGLEFDRNLSFMTERQRSDLARLGRDVKAELFDKRLQFDRDESGRKFTNERQLWDFNVASAESEEKMKNRQQSMILAQERKAVMLETVYAKAIQALEIEFQKAEQRKDHASKRSIGEYIAKVKKQQADAQSKGAKRAAVMSGMATGAAAGAATGTPYGVVIGAAIGGGTAMMAAGGPSEVI